MSIEKQKGKIILTCDECADTYDEYDADDFKQMIKDAKTDDWKIFRDDDTDEWLHWCPNCQ